MLILRLLMRFCLASRIIANALIDGRKAKMQRNLLRDFMQTFCGKLQIMGGGWVWPALSRTKQKRSRGWGYIHSVPSKRSATAFGAPLFLLHFYCAPSGVNYMQMEVVGLSRVAGAGA